MTIDCLIESLLHTWSQTRPIGSLAEILKREKKALVEKLRHASEAALGGPGLDKVRSMIVQHVFKSLPAELDARHFTFLDQPETIHVILEDSFGIEPGLMDDRIVFPYQDKVITIVTKCLFGRPQVSSDIQEVSSFMQFLLVSFEKPAADQDRIMRYKSMIWFTYFTIDMVKRLDGNGWERSVDYLRGKFEELLSRAIEGKIIDEDSAAPGYEEGKWDSSLFGWLQGEDRRKFALKLKKQFNFENRMIHANRMLLSAHRRCIFEQVAHFFAEEFQAGIRSSRICPPADPA